jgi:type IV secretory pathway TraG/TraD family ATPase VirD4
MSADRITIGERQIWGGRTSFGISAADRRQHVYVIGKTGTGKSTLLRNMMIQDIEAGRGVGFIDPHGDLAEELLDCIPPSRVRDVVYFNPADREFPIGFNLLREAGFDRHLVASGIVSAFKNVWRDSWGPRLEYILYCTVAALTGIQNATVLGIQRMLTDERYRKWVVRQVGDPAIRTFWENEFARYDKRFLAEAIAPIQNKVGQLMMSPIIRNVLGQVRSRFNPRFLMDDGRIFIANLAKGRLGEDKANLLGSMLVTAFQLAAMSRTDMPERDCRDWYLYVDEFHNFATESFASILSEARKYRLCLTLAHQFTSQIRPEIRDSVFGNVGTFVAFRVSEADATLLDREYGGGYSARRFTDLGNFEVYVKAILHGEQLEPFSARTNVRIDRRHGRRVNIVRRSRNSFATPRHTVEGRIKRWMER